jgi:Tfp pilus assembly protein PilO
LPTLGVQILWIAAPILIVVSAVVGTILFLSHERSAVRELSRQVEEQRKTLVDLTATRPLNRVRNPREVLAECRSMIENEPLRVGEISAAAVDSGVALVSIQSLEPDANEEGTIVACGHHVRGSGSYEQLAMFLDGVYAARGMAAVDDLEIEPDKDGRGVLRASLDVTWFGPLDPPSEDAQ